MKYLILIPFLLLSFPVLAEEEDACASIDTEFEMYDCLSKHYEETEQRMMATYKQALFQIDKAGKEKQKEIFMDSQQNWVAYRETTCLAETYDIIDEKEQPLMLRLCYMRIAEQRTEDIQKNFKTWDNETEQLPKKE